MAAQAKDLEKRFKNVGDAFKNVGDIFSGVGTTLTKTVTAPIMAVGTAAVSSFKEVDEALDIIVKKTGATGEAMDGFQTVFDNVASAVPADLNDVGSAVGEINTRLGFTGTELEKASEQFLKFAQLNDTDVNSAVQLVTRAMGDAGIEASNYSEVLDQLNVAGQMSGIGVDTLAESLAKYGAPMRALGIDTKNAIAMFAGWEKAGVNTSIAFSGMKKAISNWGKEGKDSAAEFSKVMQQIKDAPDIASATTLAIEAFGSKAGPDLADAIKGGRFEVDEYVKALEDASGNIDSTFESTQDGFQKFKTATNAAKIALAGFGKIIAEAVSPYVDKVTKLINQATERFKGLDSQAQKNIVKLAAIAAAVGPVLVGFGKISSGIGTVITDFGKVNKAIMKLSGASGFSGIAKIMTGPFGIAAAAVAAAAVLIYQNWDRIEPIIQKIGQRFVDFWNTVQPQLEPFIELAKKAATYLKDTFGPIIDEVFSFAGEFIVGTFDLISVGIDALLTALEGIISFLNGVFTTDWKKVWTGCKEFVGTAFSNLADMVKVPINAVISIVNGAIDKINSIHFTVPEWVPGIGGKGWEGLDIPKIPTLAKGTDSWQGGVVQISEKGGEIVDLPSGSRVYPHDESVQMARQEAKKSVTITIAKLADKIVVREETDIDKVAEAIVKKVEDAIDNMPQTA